MRKLVGFDLDGVLLKTQGYKESDNRIALSSWNILFDQLGIYDEHERLKQMYLDGHFSSYMEWTNEACKYLQKNGLTKEKYFNFVDKREFTNGALLTVKELKERKDKTAVISGSFHELALKAKEMLGLNYAIAHCGLVFDEDGKLKDWYLVPCDFEGKLIYFKRIADSYRVSYSDCIYVGDNVNDIPIFKEVGLAIAFNATKEEVKKEADIVIESNDLRKILEYI